MTDEEIKLLKDKLAFTEKESACLRDAFFEQKKKNRELYNQIARLEQKLEIEVKNASKNTAKIIFSEMYELVCNGENFTIIVNANDIKSIAKRYEVRL